MQTIALEEKDLKSLKKKKTIQFVFLIYMILLTIGIGAFAISMYLENEEPLFWRGMGFVFVSMFFVSFIVHRSWKKFETDVKNGVKNIEEGVIDDKYSHKNAHEFSIAGTIYQVGQKYYDAFEVKQTVLISFAPNTKLILDISGIDEHSLDKPLL